MENNPAACDQLLCDLKIQDRIDLGLFSKTHHPSVYNEKDAEANAQQYKNVQRCAQYAVNHPSTCDTPPVKHVAKQRQGKVSLAIRTYVLSLPKHTATAAQIAKGTREHFDDVDSINTAAVKRILGGDNTEGTEEIRAYVRSPIASWSMSTKKVAEMVYQQFGVQISPSMVAKIRQDGVVSIGEQMASLRDDVEKVMQHVLKSEFSFRDSASTTTTINPGDPKADIVEKLSLLLETGCNIDSIVFAPYPQRLVRDPRVRTLVRRHARFWIAGDRVMHKGMVRVISKVVAPDQVMFEDGSQSVTPDELFPHNKSGKPPIMTSVHLSLLSKMQTAKPSMRADDIIQCFDVSDPSSPEYEKMLMLCIRGGFMQNREPDYHILKFEDIDFDARDTKRLLQDEGEPEEEDNDLSEQFIIRSGLLILRSKKKTDGDMPILTRQEVQFFRSTQNQKMSEMTISRARRKLNLTYKKIQPIAVERNTPKLTTIRELYINYFVRGIREPTFDASTWTDHPLYKDIKSRDPKELVSLSRAIDSLIEVKGKIPEPNVKQGRGVWENLIFLDAVSVYLDSGVQKGWSEAGVVANETVKTQRGAGTKVMAGMRWPSKDSCVRKGKGDMKQDLCGPSVMTKDAGETTTNMQQSFCIDVYVPRNASHNLYNFEAYMLRVQDAYEHVKTLPKNKRTLVECKKSISKKLSSKTAPDYQLRCLQTYVLHKNMPEIINQMSSAAVDNNDDIRINLDPSKGVKSAQTLDSLQDLETARAETVSASMVTAIDDHVDFKDVTLSDKGDFMHKTQSLLDNKDTNSWKQWLDNKDDEVVASTFKLSLGLLEDEVTYKLLRQKRMLPISSSQNATILRALIGLAQRGNHLTHLTNNKATNVEKLELDVEFNEYRDNGEDLSYILVTSEKAEEFTISAMTVDFDVDTALLNSSKPDFKKVFLTRAHLHYLHQKKCRVYKTKFLAKEEPLYIEEEEACRTPPFEMYCANSAPEVRVEQPKPGKSIKYFRYAGVLYDAVKSEYVTINVGDQVSDKLKGDPVWTKWKNQHLAGLKYTKVHSGTVTKLTMGSENDIAKLLGLKVNNRLKGDAARRAWVERIVGEESKRRFTIDEIDTAVDRNGMNKVENIDKVVYARYLIGQLMWRMDLNNKIVIHDGASYFMPHNSALFDLMKEVCGCYMVTLPAYSPEFNPIELVFGLMKKWVKASEFDRDHMFLKKQILDAFNSISPRTVKNFMYHDMYSPVKFNSKEKNQTMQYTVRYQGGSRQSRIKVFNTELAVFLMPAADLKKLLAEEVTVRENVHFIMIKTWPDPAFDAQLNQMGMDSKKFTLYKISPGLMTTQLAQIGLENIVFIKRRRLR